jgi:hypothetical protein
MNALASLVALVITILAAQTPARDTRTPPPAAASTIRGRILTDDRQPIRNARVGLAAQGHEEGWPVFTDAEGAFQFSGLPAGRYILTASKAGYVTTRFGARQPLEPAVPIELDAGIVLDNVTIRLARGAAISGRIVDEDGDPVIEAGVSAGRLVRSGNGLKMVPLKSTTTDDLGEYRLPELPTGSYVVFADPARSLFNRMHGAAAMGRGGRMAFATERGPALSTQYYPAALSDAQAQRLSVQPGEELTSIDMTLGTVAVPHVSLVVTDPSGAASSAWYGLTPDERPDETDISRIQVGDRKELPASPGGWNLVVDGGSAGGAYSHFMMGQSDMTLQVALQPFVKISGRVFVDGGLRSAGAATLIEAAPRGSSSSSARVLSHGARLNPDGTFTVDAVRGAIEMRLRNPPAGWMLQSLSIGGRVLPDTWIDTSGRDAISDVAVRISTRPAILTGIVSDSSGQPVEDSVIVFPQSPALFGNPGRWFRWIKPDLTGRFTIRDLPEGEFCAVGLHDVDDAQWTAASYLEALAPQATCVTLAAGRQSTVSLSVAGSR